MPVSLKTEQILDYPFFELLADMPATNGAGMCIDDDGSRYIYLLFSTSSFWRYDTWSNSYQQLASAPGGTVGTGTNFRFVQHMGTQLNGVVYGSIYALIANSGTPVFYRYDVGTNAWSAALSVTNLPASIGTDSSLKFIQPKLNNFQSASSCMFTVTATAAAAINATAITVSALAEALPVNAVLNFGTAASPKYAVLTAAAAAAATSITVSPLLVALTGTETAQFSNHAYCVTNASTQLYRYNIASNTWFTTTHNAGNAAFPALPGAVGAGCSMRWLCGHDSTKLYILRGGGSSNIFQYDISTNAAMTTLSYQPITEVWTTGTCTAVRAKNGTTDPRPFAIVLQRNGDNRFYEFNPATLQMYPLAFSYFPHTTNVVGDKLGLMMNPSGLEFIYSLPQSRNWMTRALLTLRAY